MLPTFVGFCYCYCLFHTIPSILQVPKATPATVTKPTPATTPASAASQTKGRKCESPDDERGCNIVKCYFLIVSWWLCFRGNKHYSTQYSNRNTSCCSSTTTVVCVVRRICCFLCLFSV